MCHILKTYITTTEQIIPMSCLPAVSLMEIKHTCALSADISVDSQVPQVPQHWNKDFFEKFLLV